MEATGRIFAVLWSCAHILHAWHQGGDGLAGRIADPWLLPVLVAGLLVLARPSSPARLGLLAVAQLAAFAVQLPFVANHWTLAAFGNAGLLVALATSRRCPGARDMGGVLRWFAPYGRWLLLIAYGAAAIAKLNTTFFDPARSCAVWTLGPVADWLQLGAPSPDGILAAAVIVGVASVELAVWLLLLYRRTRPAGIILAATFHVLLAATPAVTVMDFTAFLLALLVLFGPADLGARLAAEGAAFAARRPRLAATIGRLTSGASGRLLGAASAIAVFALAGLRADLIGAEAWAVLSWAIFLTFGVTVLAVGVPTLMRRGWTVAPATGVRPSLPALALIAILMLNAASPYLGGKTTSSFTMFSNLRTEAGATNHLFLPRLPVDSPQDDLVQIIDSSDPGLLAVAEEGQLLTFHELRRRLGEVQDASITYRRDGQLVSLDRATDDPDLITQGAWSAKVLHFRDVTPDGRPICQA